MHNWLSALVILSPPSICFSFFNFVMLPFHVVFCQNRLSRLYKYIYFRSGTNTPPFRCHFSFYRIYNVYSGRSSWPSTRTRTVAMKMPHLYTSTTGRRLFIENNITKYKSYAEPKAIFCFQLDFHFIFPAIASRSKNINDIPNTKTVLQYVCVSFPWVFFLDNTMMIYFRKLKLFWVFRFTLTPGLAFFSSSLVGCCCCCCCSVVLCGGTNGDVTHSALTSFICLFIYFLFIYDLVLAREGIRLHFGHNLDILLSINRQTFEELLPGAKMNAMRVCMSCGFFVNYGYRFLTRAACCIQVSWK